MLATLPMTAVTALAPGRLDQEDTKMVNHSDEEIDYLKSLLKKK